MAPERYLRVQTLMTSDGTRQQDVGILLSQGRIAALGPHSEVGPSIGDGLEKESVGVVLPAMTDAHNHPSLFGELGAFAPIQLPSLGTLEEISAYLRPRLDPEGPLQIVLGWEAALVPCVDRHALDAIQKSPWILMDTSFHGAVGNSAAMRAFQEFLARERLELHGVIREDGTLKEEYAVIGFMVREEQTPVAGLIAGVEAYIERAWSGGAATLYDMWTLTPRQLEVLDSLSPRHRASVPITHIGPLLMRRRLAAGQPVAGMRLKLFADGATGSQTALTSRPYTSTGACGLAYHWGPEAEAALVEALENGMRDLAIHAIGDRGVDHAIALFAEWFAHARLQGVDVRARVEHLDFATPAQIARIAEMGVGISPQPNFLFDLRAFDEILPPGETARMVPLRWMVDSGAPVWMGTDGMPNNMLLALHCAVQAPYPCQKLTLAEVLARATESVSSYEGVPRGRIAVGESADLLMGDPDLIEDVCASHGLFEADGVTALGIAETLDGRLRGKVVELIRGGETLYRRSASA